MRASDRILDLGPGAGESGGQVIAAGSYDEILKAPGSLTGRYLSGELRIQLPQARRKPGSRQIKISGARAHNLKNIDFAVPLGMLVAITGVSGSGKSTLLHDVLFQALSAAKRQTNGEPLPSPDWKEVEGDDLIDDVILVDQSPIGRTPRSNPVTYIKAFDGIRDLFASLPEAKKRGFSAGHFSFNIPGRPLRNLPGRRHRHRGNAISRRRRTDLRRVQRRALQAAGPRSALSRQEHSRSPEPDGARRRCISSPACPKSWRSCACWKKWAWGICAWASPPPRFPAARRSA